MKAIDRLQTVVHRPPTPPSHLRPETAAWWSRVVADWTLEEHHVRLLTLAAEAYDRTIEARECLAKHGLTFDTPSGPKLRPETIVEKDSRIGFCRCLRELDLDCGSPAAIGSRRRCTRIGDESWRRRSAFRNRAA